MPARVEISVRRRHPEVRVPRIRSDAIAVMADLGINAELSVSLIGDAEMQRLNAHYRGKDRPTDVLSFEMDEQPEPGSAKLLGDVVISVETASRQATERGVAVADEVRTLLVHGILHLLGYDHERSPAEARKMFALQRRLIAGLDGRRRPGTERRAL